jgi:ribonuclease III, bacterial
MSEFDPEAVENILGYKFKDRAILKEAFVHSSYANEIKTKSNERLEYLGDSVLNLSVAHELFKRFPEEDEGYLTKARAKIVSAKALSGIADAINVAPHILTSGGAQTEGMKGSENVKADLIEAIIGAIFSDGGYEEAVKFIDNIIKDYQGGFDGGKIVDYKSELLEKAKKMGGDATFSTKPEYGGFVSIAYVAGKPLGRGKGANKKAAEQSAAAEALRAMEE